MFESEYKNAWEAFLSSEYGKECADVSSLEDSVYQDTFQKYLTNRLKTAFEAGWNASANVSMKIIDDGIKGNLG